MNGKVKAYLLSAIPCILTWFGFGMLQESVFMISVDTYLMLYGFIAGVVSMGSQFLFLYWYISKMVAKKSKG